MPRSVPVVKVGINTIDPGANLQGADLAGAYLTGVNLGTVNGGRADKVSEQVPVSTGCPESRRVGAGSPAAVSQGVCEMPARVLPGQRR